MAVKKSIKWQKRETLLSNKKCRISNVVSVIWLSPVSRLEAALFVKCLIMKYATSKHDHASNLIVRLALMLWNKNSINHMRRAKKLSPIASCAAVAMGFLNWLLQINLVILCVFWPPMVSKYKNTGSLILRKNKMPCVLSVLNVGSLLRILFNANYAKPNAILAV